MRRRRGRRSRGEGGEEDDCSGVGGRNEMLDIMKNTNAFSCMA